MLLVRISLWWKWLSGKLASGVSEKETKVIKYKSNVLVKKMKQELSTRFEAVLYHGAAVLNVDARVF